MLSQYKSAIIFLLKYVVIYFALNTLYAFYIEAYKPAADPMTRLVSTNAAFVLDLFEGQVKDQPDSLSVYVPIQKAGETVIEVFEGCNGINVWIVFFAFLVAFKGPLRGFLQLLLVGTLIIYIANLVRIIALYVVARHFPEALYFFHKFLFTGIIYLIVFGMWYYWMIQVKSWQQAKP